MYKITGIMACAANYVIGSNQCLPWHYPADLEHFYNTVNNNTIIMGYKTFETTPKHILDYCYNIVFTSKRLENNKNTIFVSSFAQFLKLNLQDCYMIGGSEIATLFLKNNIISTFILTEIKKEYEGNIFFPMHFLKTWKKNNILSNKDFIINEYINKNPLALTLLNK